MKQMLTKVVPLICNEALWSVAITFQNQCYSTCGLAVVSALNIVTTINNMATVAASAIGNTVGILMGQMLGASRPKEEIRGENRRLMLFAFLIGAVFGVLMAGTALFFPNLYNTSQAIRDLSAAMILVTALTKAFQSYHMSVFFTIRAGGLVSWTMLYDCGYLWLFVVPLTFVICHFTQLPFLVIYGITLLPELTKCIFGSILLRKAPWIRNLTL
jgi:Na+-driven multidrug efflux pump